MTLDGIPETLSPLRETAERPHSTVSQPPSAAGRRRAAHAPEADDQLAPETGEDHLLDDLA